MRVSVDSLKQSIARKIARILEGTRILDLSRNDAAYRASGRELIYVVDTNFLQAFVTPADHYRYSRLFHDIELWPPLERETEFEELSRSTGAQATMLATECVFSSLTKGKSLVMSRAHQLELEQQVLHLLKNNAQVTPELQVERVASQWRKIAAILNVAKMERSDAEEEMRKSSLFLGPTAKPDKDSEFEKLRDVYLISQLSEALANDQIAEPRVQLNRLQTDEFWDRFTELEVVFPGRGEEAFLAEQEGAWKGRLEVELRKRDARRPSNAPRSKDAIQADASTMARLMLAMKMAGPDRRIVFITGDSVMLNAYRKWYVENQSGDSSTYLLRPLSLYSPQYTLGESGRVLTEEVKTFERTRQAIEAWTYPFTFALQQHYYPNTPGLRFSGALARDRFCMQVEDDTVDLEFVTDALRLRENVEDLRNRSRQLDAMADGMRWIERLSIGTAKTLVLERGKTTFGYAGKFAELEKLRLNDPGAVSDVVDQWAQAQLAKIMKSGFEFSKPAASEWLRKFAATASDPKLDRLRTPLRLDLPLKGVFVQPTKWLEAFNKAKDEDEQEQLVAELGRHPACLFALASYVARQRSMWTDAIRFADFASRASMGAPEARLAEEETKNLEDDIRHECLYMKAVSLRIRIASLPVKPDGAADFWRSDLEGAEEALAECVQLRRGPVRAIRAKSERASARLSYCAWAAVGDLGALSTYSTTRLDLRSVFGSAVEDLKACAEALTDFAATKPKLSEPQQLTLKWAELQTVLGSECARIVYEILLSKVDPYFEEAYLPAMPRALSWLNQIAAYKIDPISDQDHFILRAYDLSLRARSLVPPEAAKLYAEIQALQPTDNALAMDIGMLHAVKASATARLNTIK